MVTGCASITQDLLVDGQGRGQLQWEETAIGQQATANCPCPQATISRQATRVCAAGSGSGGQWMDANVIACQFSTNTWNLCNAEVRMVTLCHASSDFITT